MNSPYEIKRSIPVLGTFFEVKYQYDGRDLLDFITSVFDEVKKLESLLSYHNDMSALSAFNNSGMTSCTELKLLIRISKYLYQKTSGVFNPVDPKSHKVDLGGIAKGFIVDIAAKMLQKQNVSGIINAGGDMRIFGLYQAPIYIRNPFDFTKNIFLGNFTNISIASSCITPNSRRRGGKSIVYQKSDIVHATVIGTNCTMCDALTKVAMTNPDIASSILNYLGYNGIIFDKYGNKFVSH